MSTELQPGEEHSITSQLDPPDIDEAYWAALLDEGAAPDQEPAASDDNGWQHYNPDDHSGLQSDYLPYTNQQDWAQAKNYVENDLSIELSITGYNRGGLLVTWNSLRGFVPASQLVDFPVDVDEATRRELLSKRVGTSLRLRIIELDIAANRLIFSERAAQVESGQRAAVLSELKPGTVCKGRVTNLCDFGAFVDLGGIEGLIHISELSWGRVGHPRDVLSSGQQIDVYIMAVEPDEERIALSLKRLQPDPWESVEKRYEIGQLVEGNITNVVDFGAFACIEEGLEGLIHVSELAEGQFLHPRNVIDEGDRVVARILNIDGNARRLGLSLRNVNGDQNEDD
jgi:small subunit ribosomal protein S1